MNEKVSPDNKEDIKIKYRVKGHKTRHDLAPIGKKWDTVSIKKNKE